MMGELTEAGTPKSIHTVPGWVSGKTPQPFSLSAQELEALAEGILTGVEHWIALALNGVTIFGVHPFEVLQAFGQDPGGAITDIKALINKIRGTADLFTTIDDAIDAIQSATLNDVGVIAEMVANITNHQWFKDLKQVLGGDFLTGLGTGSPGVPALSNIPLFGTLAKFSDTDVISEIVSYIRTHQWFIDLKNTFGGDHWGLGTGTLTKPSLDDIPILGPIVDKVAGKVNAIGDDVQSRLQHIAVEADGIGVGLWKDASKIVTTISSEVTDVETAAQGIRDAAAGIAGSALSDIDARLQFLLTDGTGIMQGLGVLHSFGLSGDDAHQYLRDAICNAFGMSGSGHGHADVQTASATIFKQLNEVINGKKAYFFVDGRGTGSSANFDPASAASWMVDSDLLYPLALGGASGGAGGSGLLHGLGGHAGSWSSTSVAALVRGTDWHSGDTFDYYVGRGGSGGPIPGGASNPGENSTITKHGGSVIATGTGGSSVTGTSGTLDAWWGDGVSPTTNTVGGTPITGGLAQQAAGKAGHSSGGAGAGGNIGYSLSAGGPGASGLIAILLVQA